MSEEEAKEEVVVVRELVKDKIISLWLHFWLKRVAKKYPDFFMKMLDDIVDSDKGKTIMKARYIDRLKFKQISGLVNLEERQIYKIHQKIIKHLIHL
jgi:hypothetical protein